MARQRLCWPSIFSKEPVTSDMMQDTEEPSVNPYTLCPGCSRQACDHRASYFAQMRLPGHQPERQAVNGTRESTGSSGHLHRSDTCLRHAVAKQAGQKSIQSKCQTPQNQKRLQNTVQPAQCEPSYCPL